MIAAEGQKEYVLRTRRLILRCNQKWKVHRSWYWFSTCTRITAGYGGKNTVNYGRLKTVSRLRTDVPLLGMCATSFPGRSPSIPRGAKAVQLGRHGYGDRIADPYLRLVRLRRTALVHGLIRAVINAFSYVVTDSQLSLQWLSSVQLSHSSSLLSSTRPYQP